MSNMYEGFTQEDIDKLRGNIDEYPRELILDLFAYITFHVKRDDNKYIEMYLYKKDKKAQRRVIKLLYSLGIISNLSPEAGSINKACFTLTDIDKFKRAYHIVMNNEVKRVMFDTECNRCSVFLFQEKMYSCPGGLDFPLELTEDVYICADEGFYYICDKDGNMLYTDDENEEPMESNITNDDLVERGYMEFYWNTKYVFATREEAEHYGTIKNYNYGVKGKDWRVYSVNAMWKMEDMLKANTIDCTSWGEGKL